MSSKRRLRRNACTGKVRYVTAADAHLARRRLAGQGRVLNVYRCAFHTTNTPRHWHLGHSDTVMRP